MIKYWYERKGPDLVIIHDEFGSTPYNRRSCLIAIKNVKAEKSFATEAAREKILKRLENALPYFEEESQP